jgi:hypothetical protein
MKNSITQKTDKTALKIFRAKQSALADDLDKVRAEEAAKAEAKPVTDKHPSWRDFYQVHPACDAWPELPAVERKALRANIDAKGLKVPIQTREVVGDNNAKYVIDGRTRLDLMEELGWQIVNEKGDWIGAAAGKVAHKVGRTHEEIGQEVNSYNGHRRHLPKEQLVKSIDDTIRKCREAGKSPNGFTHESTDPAVTARSVRRGAGGRLEGSTKDEHKAAVVEQAAKVGISKRTVERVLAKGRTAPKKPRKVKEQSFEDQVWAKWSRWLKTFPPQDRRRVKVVVGGFCSSEDKADAKEGGN